MHIFVRPLAGGTATRLVTDTTGNEWLPRWAPDGKRILFLSNGGAFSAPASGGSARLEVPSRPGVVVTSATWSPDGSEIAFVRGDSLLARNVATHHDRFVTTGFDLHSCNWSPVGDRLACVSGNHFYITVGTLVGLGPMFGNLAPSRIVIIPAAGGTAVSVTDSGSLHQSPVWSRDGNDAVLRLGSRGPARYLRAHSRWECADSSRAGAPDDGHRCAIGRLLARTVRTWCTRCIARTANVWAMPIASGNPESAASAVQITSGNQTVEGVRVSGDGKWLVYDSDLGGNSDIYRVPVSGRRSPSDSRAVPATSIAARSLRTGTSLTYHAFDAGSRQVFLLPIGGGSAAAAHAVDRSAVDGELVARRQRTHVFRHGLGGCTRHASRSRPPLECSAIRRRPWVASGMVARPDVRSCSCLLPPVALPLFQQTQAPSGMCTFRARDGPPAELAIFSANGREVYFKSHDAEGRASFWSIPVSGGRPRLLARFDDPARASNRFDFASDGRRFYFTVEDRQSDIWVADVSRR